MDMVLGVCHKKVALKEAFIAMRCSEKAFFGGIEELGGGSGWRSLWILY